MGKIRRIIISIIALSTTLSVSCQVSYTNSYNWEKELHVFPQVLMFTADWCAPSESVKESINRLYLEYAGRVQFYFVDVDDDPQWASEWSCSVLPTTYFIYESNVSNDVCKWMALTSTVPYYKLKEQVEWLLANWTLKGLPNPVKISESNENTDILSIMNAALGGDVESMVYLGNTMPHTGSYFDSERGLMWYYLAAKNGNADATFYLGKHIANYENSSRKGIELMEKAAENGSKLAIDYMIEVYRYGYYGIPIDSQREAYYIQLQSKYK